MELRVEQLSCCQFVGNRKILVVSEMVREIKIIRRFVHEHEISVVES